MGLHHAERDGYLVARPHHAERDGYNFLARVIGQVGLPVRGDFQAGRWPVPRPPPSPDDSRRRSETPPYVRVVRFGAEVTSTSAFALPSRAVLVSGSGETTPDPTSSAAGLVLSRPANTLPLRSGGPGGW